MSYSSSKRNISREEMGESWPAKLAPDQGSPYSQTSLGVMSALVSCWSLSLGFLVFLPSF